MTFPNSQRTAISKRPAAPPVYQPNRKNSVSPPTAGANALQPKLPPGAPPVYKPFANGLQPKVASGAPPVYKPANGLQPKPSSGAPPVYNPAPNRQPPVAVYRPHTNPNSLQRRANQARSATTIQRAQESPFGEAGDKVGDNNLALPGELALRIVSYLPPADRGRFALTSRAGRNAINTLRIHAAALFMSQSVGPWATQARIAQLVDENMRDLREDESVTEKLTYFRPHLLRSPHSENPQIAPGESALLAPSRSRGREEGTTSVIHRGDLEIELIDNVPYVRVYVSLWAEARADLTGKIKYKDVHQNPESGKITVHTGKDQGEQREDDDEKMPIMWISGGQPLRQLKWFYKYPIEKYNPGAKPVVRCFLVSLDIWNRISASAVNEEVARRPENKDKPFNVDTAYGANQFGLRGPMLELLRQSAVPGSLISYTGEQGHSLEAYGGDIRHIQELRDKMGAPTGPEPVPIWVDPKIGKFVRTGKQGSIADELMFYYAVWTGNDHFLPKEKRHIPKPRRHEMLRAYLKKQGRPLPLNYVLP